jgi:hypothetical protein
MFYTGLGRDPRNGGGVLKGTFELLVATKTNIELGRQSPFKFAPEPLVSSTSLSWFTIVAKWIGALTLLFWLSCEGRKHAAWQILRILDNRPA